MGSGKSLLTKQPFGLGTRQSANIELDRFLRAPVNPDNDYMVAFNMDAATAAMMEALRISPLVLAGPVAWPVVRLIVQGIPRPCSSSRVLEANVLEEPQRVEGF